MTDILLVRDLMTVGVPTCGPDMPITQLVRRLLDGELEAVIVLDHEGHAVGVVSRDELVWAYARGDRDRLTAEAIMNEQVHEIPPDIPVTVAAQIMQDLGVRVIFLMHNADGISYPAAFLSYRHLLRHLGAQDHAELKDLGIRAKREAPLDTFIKRRDAARKRAQSSHEE